MSNPQERVLPYAGDLSVLFPGTKVPLDETGEHFAIVYPVPFKQITALTVGFYTGVLSMFRGEEGMPKLSNGQIDMDAVRAILSEKLPEMAPKVAAAMWDLVRSSCKPDPDELPPDYAIPVAMAFVQENFLNGARRKNWEAAAEAIVESLTGRRISISETISRFSSPLITAFRKYLTDKGLTAGETTSPSAGGQSPSSGITSSGPAPTEQTSGRRSSTTRSRRSGA